MFKIKTFFYHEQLEPSRTFDLLAHSYSQNIFDNYLKILGNNVKILKNKFVEEPKVLFVWFVVKFLDNARGAV